MEPYQQDKASSGPGYPSHSPASDLSSSSSGPPTLPRDSRGSLDVFTPSGYSSSAFHAPSSSLFTRETEGQTNNFSGLGAGIVSSGTGVGKSYTSDKQPAIESSIGHQGRRYEEDVASEFSLESSDAGVQRTEEVGKDDIQVDWPADSDRAGHISVAKGEGKELSDDGVAERAAQWGLVVKGSGSTAGVGPRTSGEEKRSHSSQHKRTSLTLRSSEDSEPGSHHNPVVSRDLKDALETFQQTFVVSDATRPHFPILYASAGFFNMTGYSSKEVIGRNCRFLQGADTDPDDVARIREALAEGKNYCGRLLNYKKDGTAFWNLLTIAPIKDDEGNVLKYIGMQVEVSKHTEGHKVKALRPNGLPESLIKYDARQKDRAVMEVTELLQAVKRPNRASHQLPQSLKSSIGDVAPAPLSSDRRSSLGAVKGDQTSEGVAKSHRSSGFRMLIGLDKFGKSAHHQEPAEFIEPEILMTRDEANYDSLDELDDKERLQEIRRGIDLATTLERIEKNFVITDPRLPDNPIIFASDSFLELTEFTREEIIGRNCRFLQGTETDQKTVQKIRDAIREQREITVQLLNYTKSGKKFWNLFHLQPMRDQKGELQYFIGVQLDGSEPLQPIQRRLSEKTEKEGAKIVRATARNVDEAVRELPDANLTPEDLWANHSKSVSPKPHKVHSDLWKAIQKIRDRGERISLKHFRPVKPLGFGDTGSVHLVELRGSGELFAIKAMEKSVMLNRNKVHRACAEREILANLDHPFLPTLYASFQTKTHVCLVTDFCPGGELFLVLDRQPLKVFSEETARFYLAEVVIALEYLHCQGIVYRDLKPENVLLQKDGHIVLTDFDLSFITSCTPELVRPTNPPGRQHRYKPVPPPFFMAEPVNTSNSFVGTEEYIAPEVITGAGHSSAVDWWAVGILLYEMIYGRTPFRGKNRQKTFANVLHKDLTFPSSIPASLAARQLIHGLLHRDPANRLGSASGAYEIKNHAFFRGIYWPLIRDMAPPSLEAPLELVGKDPDFDSKEAPEWDELEASTPYVSDVF
uniref:non-specific serine/threonine protein kinase n=1 Tax=Pityrogramma trifoliata TaxID=164275 RepID=A0A126X2E0_9MONI